MSNPDNTIRSFIAVELPPQVRALLGTIQAELQESMGDAARAIRWVNPMSTHLTLQFLGEVPLSLVAQIEEGIETACTGTAPFTLIVGGLGTFPNLRQPRVVWVGLDGDPLAMNALRTLQSAVVGHMKSLGFKPDNSFKPHLTLGRVREGASREDLAAIGDTLRYPEARPAFSASFDVEGVSLMRSDLRPGGAVYTQLAHVELASPA